jgi:flagellar protein FlbT
MGLRIELKAGDQIIVGSSAIENAGSHRAVLVISGREPILRSKHVLTLATADTPAKLIYYAVQTMLISDNPEKVLADYARLVEAYLEAAPSSSDLIGELQALVAEGRYYPALLKARDLIEFESAILGGRAEPE